MVSIKTRVVSIKRRLNEWGRRRGAAPDDDPCRPHLVTMQLRPT